MFATNWISKLKSGRRSGRANAKFAYGEVLETRQLLSAEVAATPTVTIESDQGNEPAESQSSVDHNQHQVEVDFLRWIQTTTNPTSDSGFESSGPQVQFELSSNGFAASLSSGGNGDSDKGFRSQNFPSGGNDSVSADASSVLMDGSSRAIDRNGVGETPDSKVTKLPSDDLVIGIESRSASAVEFSQNQANPPPAFETTSEELIDQLFQDSTSGNSEFFSNLEHENEHSKSAVAPENLGRIRPIESLTAELGSRIDPTQSVSQNTAERVRNREDRFFTFENGKLVEVTAPELRQELLGSMSDAALNPSEVISASLGFTPSEWSQLRSRDAQTLNRTPSQSGRRRTAMDFIEWRD